MNKLNVDTGYDKIQYCIVCGGNLITKNSYDNHTMVNIECNSCNNESIISLCDIEEV